MMMVSKVENDVGNSKYIKSAFYFPLAFLFSANMFGFLSVQMCMFVLLGVMYGLFINGSTPVDETQRLHDKKRSSIVLVGAGLGDPDLLTVLALKHLKNADFVVSDMLVSREILRLVDKDRLFVANKPKGKAQEGQNELMQVCLKALKQGKTVVRLKIGDPYLYSRATEEVRFFEARGYKPLVVPGLSSALTGPLSAGIPLTSRGVADEVVISTGMVMKGSLSRLPEYHTKRTIVYLMAVGKLPSLSRNMVLRGYPRDFPVAIIERATTTKERVFRGTLENIVRIAKINGVVSPAVIVIGKTASLDMKLATLEYSRNTRDHGEHGDTMIV